MQLRPCHRVWACFAVFGVGWLAAQPSASHADVQGASRLTLFREPASQSEGITVIHPQTDVSATLGGASLAAGYEVDIVSGATPRVFGGVDAVSAATRFSDLRQTVKSSLGWNVSDVGLLAGYSYGWESDYLSHTLQVAARGDFLEKNFTLGLAYTRNFDTVCDANNGLAQGVLALRALGSSARCFEGGQTETVKRDLDIHTLEPSLTWTATPRLLLQLGVSLQLLEGFQSNPYRQVLVGSQGRTPQERVPAQRQRYALFGRAHYALPALRAAVALHGRAYRDSWDLLAATADLWIHKYLMEGLLLGLHGRYHRQTGAVFYRSAADYERLGPAGSYWTGDRELSPFGTLSSGLKLTYIRSRQQRPEAWLDTLEVSMKFEGMFYQLEEGAPNRDRTKALVAQLGVLARF